MSINKISIKDRSYLDLTATRYLNSKSPSEPKSHVITNIWLDRVRMIVGISCSIIFNNNNDELIWNTHQGSTLIIFKHTLSS